MSTRSTISVVRSDGKIESIYCHFDGYPEHQLPILERYYNTLEEALDLTKLGDLSSLDNSPLRPDGHSFATPVPGYCVAYGRDRGERDTEARVYNSPLEIQREVYNYVFIDGSWKVSR